MIDAIARHLDTGNHADARIRAVGLFTLLVASLQLARAVDDRELSDQILAAAHVNAMSLAGADRRSATRGQEAR